LAGVILQGGSLDQARAFATGSGSTGASHRSAQDVHDGRRGVVEYASAKPDGDRASAEVFVGAICRSLKRLSILASFCQNRT